MDEDRKKSYIGSGAALIAVGVAIAVTVSVVGGIMMGVSGALMIASAYGLGRRT